MLRKFTAISFLLVMTMVITLKHPVLGYCMCLDAYFTGDCSCQVALMDTSATASDQSTPPPKPCCSSCTSEAASQKPDTPTTSTQSTEPAPCDDCVKQLVVDVGQFYWQSLDDVPSDTETLIVPHPVQPEKTASPPIVFRASTAIRGDPPPDIVGYKRPIYLRHSVFRL